MCLSQSRKQQHVCVLLGFFSDLPVDQIRFELAAVMRSNISLSLSLLKMTRLLRELWSTCRAVFLFLFFLFLWTHLSTSETKSGHLKREDLTRSRTHVDLCRPLVPADWCQFVIQLSVCGRKSCSCWSRLEMICESMEASELPRCVNTRRPHVWQLPVSSSSVIWIFSTWFSSVSFWSQDHWVHGLVILLQLPSAPSFFILVLCCSEEVKIHQLNSKSNVKVQVSHLKSTCTCKVQIPNTSLKMKFYVHVLKYT